MKQPTCSLEEVLYVLIEKGSVSIMDFSYLSGFRTRVSDLRKLGVKMEEVSVTFENKFKRTCKYANHILLNKEEAIKIYASRF